MTDNAGIRLTDPCYYCRRPLREVQKSGCGSQEIRSPDRMCRIVEWARVSPNK